MPDVKQINALLLWAEPVINAKRCVQQLPHTWLAFHNRAHKRKLRQQVNVVQKSGEEPSTGMSMLLPGPRGDFFQIL